MKKLTLLLTLFTLFSGAAWAQDLGITAGQVFTIKSTDGRGYLVYSQAEGFVYEEAPTLAALTKYNSSDFPSSIELDGVHAGWAFIEKDGKKYLYNIEKQAFLSTTSNEYLKFSTAAPSPMEFVNSSTGIWCIDMGKAYLCAGPGYSGRVHYKQVIIAYGTGNDGGNTFNIEKVTDEDGNATMVSTDVQKKMLSMLPPAPGDKFTIWNIDTEFDRGYVVYSNAEGFVNNDRPTLESSFSPKAGTSPMPTDTATTGVYEEWSYVEDTKGNKYLYNVHKKSFVAIGAWDSDAYLTRFCDILPDAFTMSVDASNSSVYNIFYGDTHLCAGPYHGLEYSVRLQPNSADIDEGNRFQIRLATTTTDGVVTVAKVGDALQSEMEGRLKLDEKFTIQCAHTERGYVTCNTKYPEAPCLADVTLVDSWTGADLSLKFPYKIEDADVYEEWVFVDDNANPGNRYLYNIDRRLFMTTSTTSGGSMAFGVATNVDPKIYDTDDEGKTKWNIVVGGKYICAAPGASGNTGVIGQDAYGDIGNEFYLAKTNNALTETEQDYVANSIAYAPYLVAVEKAEKIAPLLGDGESVGYLTSTTSAALIEAFASAKADDTNSDKWAGHATTLNDAVTAYEASEKTTIQPQADKYYRIVSASTLTYCQGQYVYVADNGGMFFETKDEASPLKYVFRFKQDDNGNMYMYNIERGVYANDFPYSNYASAKGLDMSAAKKVTIANAGKENIVSITPEKQQMMHAREHDYSIVGYNATDVTAASAWKIEEVKDITDLSHSVTIGTAGWSTLYLGYDATIPSDVTAYTVSETTDSKATLTKVDGVIPANTAVMLKGNAGTYDFNVDDASATAPGDLVNALEGTGITINVKPADGTTPYVLSKVDGTVGFYRATLNKDENTAFQNNAFKAYLPVSDATTLASRFLIFDFGDGTETGIEAIEGSDQSNGATIYDLSGRRVQNVQKGIYILNGKKVIK